MGARGEEIWLIYKKNDWVKDGVIWYRMTDALVISIRDYRSRGSCKCDSWCDWLISLLLHLGFVGLCFTSCMLWGNKWVPAWLDSLLHLIVSRTWGLGVEHHTSLLSQGQSRVAGSIFQQGLQRDPEKKNCYGIFSWIKHLLKKGFHRTRQFLVPVTGWWPDTTACLAEHTKNHRRFWVSKATTWKGQLTQAKVKPGMAYLGGNFTSASGIDIPKESGTLWWRLQPDTPSPGVASVQNPPLRKITIESGPSHLRALKAPTFWFPLVFFSISPWAT